MLQQMGWLVPQRAEAVEEQLLALVEDLPWVLQVEDSVLLHSSTLSFRDPNHTCLLLHLDSSASACLPRKAHPAAVLHPSHLLLADHYCSLLCWERLTLLVVAVLQELAAHLQAQHSFPFLCR